VSRLFEIIRRDWFLLGVCLVLTGAYFFYFVGRAHVDLSIDVEKRTFFRVYWSEQGESFSQAHHARVLVSPEQQDYQFFLTDIGNISTIRIDPHEYTGKSVISRLVISQKGWESIKMGGDRSFAALAPLAHIDAFTTDHNKLETISSGNDPQFLYGLTAQPASFGWFAELFRLLIIFLLLYAG